MGQTPEGIIIVLRIPSDQFLIESLIASVFIGLGAGGCYMILYSTRFAYDPRTSLTLLIIGITLTLIAASVILVMYDYKTNIIIDEFEESL